MDWKPIRAEYIAGGTSYRKLAQKYDVPLSNLYRVAKNEQWVKLRQQADNKAMAKTIEAVSKQSADVSNKVIEVADKLLTIIGNTIDNLDVIDSQSLKHYTSALKDLKDIKSIKSDADMREQEARIAKLQKEAMKEDDGSTEVIVTFGTEGEHNTWAE